MRMPSGGCYRGRRRPLCGASPGHGMPTPPGRPGTVPPVPEEDPTARFAELVQRPEEELPLDEGALLIAAHANPELDVEFELALLDDLAERCPAPTLDALRQHLFVDLGFTGNVDDYYDPDNSFLDQVVRRRVGLPIALSVLGIEVGRRLGLRLGGVALPGHFLLRHDGGDEPL